MTLAPRLTDSEIVQCPDCGMTWFTRRLCGTCAFRATPDPDCHECGGNVEYGLTAAHVCPEPFPYDVAQVMAHSGAVVSQRTAARVRLGLKRLPEKEQPLIDINDNDVIERLAIHLYAQCVRRDQMTPAWGQQAEATRRLWREEAVEALEVARGA